MWLCRFFPFYVPPDKQITFFQKLVVLRFVIDCFAPTLRRLVKLVFLLLRYLVLCGRKRKWEGTVGKCSLLPNLQNNA